MSISPSSWTQLPPDGRSCCGYIAPARSTNFGATSPGGAAGPGRDKRPASNRCGDLSGPLPSPQSGLTGSVPAGSSAAGGDGITTARSGAVSTPSMRWTGNEDLTQTRGDQSGTQ